MRSPLKGTGITVLYPIDQFDKQNWSKDQIQKWVTNAGGRHFTKLTDDTTHLVCSEKQWRNQVELIKHALSAKDQSGKHMKIVSPDWLEEALRNQRKPRESPFLWEKLDKAYTNAAKNGAKTKDERAKQTDKMPSTKSLLAEVFVNSTDQYVDERDRQRLEKQAEQTRNEALEKAKLERQQKDEEKRKRMEEVKAIFARGAKKARNEIFSNNHHIYVDETGFKYDVLLTKVDTRRNRNERFALTLQIYESNAEPNTYAFNLQFAGSGRLPSNNVLAAIGCNYMTAFRAFKKAFKEKTGVEWDDRISFAVERAKLEKRNRGQGTGSPEGTQRGKPVSERSVAQNGEITEDDDFGSLPFQYHPPLYGARGVLPKKDENKFVEIERTSDETQGNRHGDIQLWMSEANGARTLPNSHVPFHFAEFSDNSDRFQDEWQAEANRHRKMPNGTSGHYDQTLGCAADYPFDGDNESDFGNIQADISMIQASEAAAQAGMMHGAVDLTNRITPMAPDAQSFGHTQAAEAAMLQFQNFADEQDSQAGYQETQQDNGQTLLDLGSSILGKRKYGLSAQEAGHRDGFPVTAVTGARDEAVGNRPEQCCKPMFSCEAGEEETRDSVSRSLAEAHASATQLENELLSKAPPGERIALEH